MWDQTSALLSYRMETHIFYPFFGVVFIYKKYISNKYSEQCACPAIHFRGFMNICLMYIPAPRMQTLWKAEGGRRTGYKTLCLPVFLPKYLLRSFPTCLAQGGRRQSRSLGLGTHAHTLAPPVPGGANERETWICRK